jgi:hypothetical protein
VWWGPVILATQEEEMEECGLRPAWPKELVRPYLKKKKVCQVRWLTPAILASQEEEIKRIIKAKFHKIASQPIN